MRGYWYPTDQDWFDFLGGNGDWDEVNYWQPNGHSPIGKLERGAPFFFKLKSPHNHVAGFGFFDRHPEASVYAAWDAFNTANGAPDFATMVRRIEHYRGIREHDPGAPYRIGCIMLQEPVFLPKDLWIRAPASWKVQGPAKGSGIDMTTSESRLFWAQCLSSATRLANDRPLRRVPIAADSDVELRRVIPRKGQPLFRFALLDAYEHACAVTNEHSEPVLEAAHIRDYAEDRTYEVPNGLLLRADIHRLFGSGYVTVTPDFKFLVSPQLERMWNNGKMYYELAERVGKIRLPRNPEDWPDRRLLEQHYTERFRS